MEQDQPPFAIQLQRREMTLSQRNRPHPYLNSPNSGTYESRNQGIEPILVSVKIIALSVSLFLNYSQKTTNFV